MNVSSMMKRGMMMLFISLLALSLSACSGGGGSSPAPGNTPAPSGDSGGGSGGNEGAGDAAGSQMDQTPVTLKVGTWLPAAALEDPTQSWGLFLADFEKKYPWITLEMVNYPSREAPTALTEAIAAGRPFDVFWGETFRNFVDEGYAEELTPYIEADAEFQQFNFKPGVMESFQVDGKQWAVSRGNDSFLIFYNKDLFDKYGVDYPANDWTWEDFRRTAIELTHPEDNVWGVEHHSFWHYFITGVIPYNNGHTANNRMMSEDHTRSVADDPDVLEDLQWFYDIDQKDGAMLNDKLKEELGIEGEAWPLGNAAMTVMPSPVIGSYNNSITFQWDIAPIPAGSVQQKGIGFNSAMFMAKASPNKDAAWLFIKWWASDREAQKILQDIGGSFPATTDNDLVEAFKNAEVYKNVNQSALAHASSMMEPDLLAYIPKGDKVSQAYNGFYAVIEEQTPYDYYPQAVEQLNAELAKP